MTDNTINKAFEAECQAEIARQGDDQKLTGLARDFFNESARHKYSYHFSWMGRPIIQYPQDMAAMQELIWSVKPDHMIETGIALAIPHGYYGKIEARSGLALKYGVMIQAGIVDSDYRGTVRVLAFVAGTDIWAIKAGDKIAQLLILPVPEFEPVKVESLDETARGAGGFGSTGR